MIKSNIKYTLEHIIYQRICEVVKRQRQAPKQELKPFTRLPIKPTMADLSKGLELMTLFCRFHQRDSNSSLKFEQLTAKCLKSSVSNLQINREHHQSNLLLQMLY